MKTVSYQEMKAAEAQNRMAAVRRARKDGRSARALQKRASLVGVGAKWRITNFGAVARAMTRWA
ncbi:MAG: hypothetical protein AAB676_02640 [Verrucomicrobiota bacterium]